MKQKGFTLIELMIVIAIIGTLSSIVFTSLNNSRMKARDAKRIQDFRQIQIALELYKQDNGTYPIVWYFANSTDADWDTTSTLQTALAPYIGKLPKDPKNNHTDPWWDGNYAYAYGFAPPATTYDLVTQLEDHSNKERCELKGWMYIHSAVSWCQNGYSLYTYAGPNQNQ